MSGRGFLLLMAFLLGAGAVFAVLAAIAWNAA